MTAPPSDPKIARHKSARSAVYREPREATLGVTVNTGLISKMISQNWSFDHLFRAFSTCFFFEIRIAKIKNFRFQKA